MFKKEWEEGWTVGPTKAWLKCLQEDKIIDLERKDYCFGRGMSWGKYMR
jgi:hypothetical protein